MTTTAPWPPGQTPYVTPDMLTQWPIGVQWNSLPPTVGSSAPTDQQRYAVQAMICLAATSDANQIANQPLHCTQTTEELEGPNFRVTVQWSSGNGRIITSRWPVTQVTSVQVAPNAGWPRQFTALPAASYEPEFPVDGLYGASVPSAGAGGQTILFAPGYVCWPAGGFGWPGGQVSGRQRFRVAFTYFSGYPHTSLTAAATAGTSTISVDSCNGWVLTGTNNATTGAAGIIYDALGGGQEGIQVTASSAVTGPGTLTLASPLTYAHEPLKVVSAMPQSLLLATAYLAGKAALMRGATATTIQTTGGGRQQQAMHPYEAEARRLINQFKRTI